MKSGKRRTNRMVWWKQIFPRTLYTIDQGEENGPRYFEIWRQWLGRAYDLRRVPISESY